LVAGGFTMTPTALKQFIPTYTDEVWNHHQVAA
jgi:hypothetical protein